MNYVTSSSLTYIKCKLPVQLDWSEMQGNAPIVHLISAYLHYPLKLNVVNVRKVMKGCN